MPVHPTSSPSARPSPFAARGLDAAARGLAAAALTVLAACASAPSPEGLAPGQSTQAQVEARMGKPNADIKTADGGHTQFYTSGEGGLSTYAVHLGSNGVVSAIGQTLTPENVRRVRSRVGRMTSDEVLALFGPPFHVIHFERQGFTSWDYHVMDSELYLFSPQFSAEGVLRDAPYVPESELKGVGEAVK